MSKPISVTARLAETVAQVRERQPLSERKREILQAALRIIVDGGFEALSLRRVAEDVGVKLPSVQYHFGSKDGLVAALFHWALDWYSGELLKLVAANPENPEKAFRQVIDYLVKDLDKRTGIEPHIWAYAMYSEDANSHREWYMLVYREFIFDLLTQLDTISPKQARWYRAAQITALIEGTYQLTSTGVPTDLRKYQSELKTTIWRLAELVP